MMPPKAYRWVAEMQEIAGFVGEDPAAHDLYEGAADFYERFAEDFECGQERTSPRWRRFWARARPERDARGYRFSHRRAKPSSPCGRKMIMAMKMMPSGIRYGN